MSNSKRNKDTVVSGQASLFDNGLADGVLDVRLAFRDSVSKALRSCRHSRYHVAAEMSRLTERDVSASVLDKCIGSDFNYGVRAEDLPALVSITGDLNIIKTLLQPLEIEVLSPEDARFYRLAQLLQKRAALDAEIKQLEAKR